MISGQVKLFRPKIIYPIENLKRSQQSAHFSFHYLNNNQIAMIHQFRHSMTHNYESSNNNRSLQQQFIDRQTYHRPTNFSLTSFALQLPPLYRSPASRAHLADAGLVVLPCLGPGLVRCCGGWSSMGSSAPAHSVAFSGNPATAAAGFYGGPLNFGPRPTHNLAFRALTSHHQP